MPVDEAGELDHAIEERECRVFGQRIREFTWKKCIFRQIAKSLPLHLACLSMNRENRIPQLEVVVVA